MKNASLIQKKRGRPKSEQEFSPESLRTMCEQAYDEFFYTKDVIKAYKEVGSSLIQELYENFHEPTVKQLFQFLTRQKLLQFFSIPDRGDLVFFEDGSDLKVTLVHEMHIRDKKLLVLLPNESGEYEIKVMPKYYCFGKVTR